MTTTTNYADRDTHILAQPGDRQSLCGLRDPLPRVWSRYVDAHVNGRGMTVCPDCHAVLNGEA